MTVTKMKVATKIMIPILVARDAKVRKMKIKPRINIQQSNAIQLIVIKQVVILQINND